MRVAAPLLLFVLGLLESLSFHTNAILPPPKRRANQALSSLSTATASLLAGFVAGATGVLVAYPFDTIKTKTQAIANQREHSTSKSLSNTDLVKRVFEDEGVEGFYQGVKPAMVGQFFIKAVAFSVNANALNIFSGGDAGNVGFVTLIAAAW